jgi:hypothetical protein
MTEHLLIIERAEKPSPCCFTQRSIEEAAKAAGIGANKAHLNRDSGEAAEPVNSYRYSLISGLTALVVTKHERRSIIHR